MSPVVRPLTPADQSAAWTMSSIAFGYTDRTMPEGWTSDRPGRYIWGAFEDDQLVAKALDREQAHWFGGSLVPASGVAGVAVLPELRGRGLAGLVLRDLLSAARERGAAISTLFDTTPYPYRRVGYEEIGALVRAAVPTASLSGVRAPAELTLRPATAEDVPLLQSVYREFARSGTALMDRDAAHWLRDPVEYLSAYHGVCVAAAADGTIEAYASYDRGPGYDHTGRLVLDDLIALTPAGAQAMAAFLASWASVAPTLSMKVVPGDPVAMSVALGRTPVESRQPWMLRVIDAPAAIDGRGWPEFVHGEVDLQLVDELCPWNAGPHVLRLDGGTARLEPGGTGAVRLTERGLALWYAGGLAPAALRRAGVLSGPDKWDPLLLAATAGPTPVLLDYF
jgi:predicted acetyltransferase